jgi:hypothetical protein
VTRYLPLSSAETRAPKDGSPPVGAVSLITNSKLAFCPALPNSIVCGVTDRATLLGDDQDARYVARPAPTLVTVLLKRISPELALAPKVAMNDG